MSDYGSRSHGSGSEEHGWDGAGRSRGFGDSYDDYAPQQRGDGYGDGGGYGDRGHSDRGYGDSGYGSGGYGDRGGYGDGYGDSGSADPYSVRSASPHDEPATSGRARVPGGDPTGPGRARGSARVGGKRASGLSDEESEDMKKAKKKKKRRRRFIALACVLVMFLGIGTVVGTLFFEGVPLPEEVAAELDRNTTITYAGGKEMGKIGTEFGNRTYVDVLKKDQKPKEDKDVPNHVKFALLAMEDRGFYEHDGVDFWGVMRALVNNVTGGETQGASTLTQQYVGSVLDIRNDQTYLRKAKEAVMAMKMDDKYDKDTIIEHYMNLVYMGRGAYGLGAAVKAWFGEKQKVKDLTAAQAAILFAQVKSPDGTFDPVLTGSDKELKGRWKYALNGMVEEGWLKDAERDKFIEDGLPKYTKTKSMSANSGLDKATGFVSHSQVIKEAKENYGLSEEQIRRNGYTIETTIDPKLQKIVEKVAKKDGGTAMGDEAKNLRAALVAINPRNGEVVAYYGGNQDGSTVDKADAVHAQGSQFKEVTVAAAVKAGWGPESHWDGSSPREFEERANGELRNSGEGRGANEPNITLRQATVKSLNTPMYAISTQVGANTIVKLAHDMGVQKMQVPEIGCTEECEHVVYPLNGKGKLGKAAQEAIKGNARSFADNEVSFGQFPVSVVDMASVNSTLAADGVRRDTHFIKKITDADGNKVEPTNGPAEDEALKPEVARDVTNILTGVKPNVLGGNKFDNGQTYAAKSGTWERDCGDEECNENASVTFGGYVPELAAAAWVGDQENENGSVVDVNGQPAYGAGISGEVWAQFMQEAVTVKGYDSKTPFQPGPGGKGTKPSEVDAGDGGEDGEGGEDGGGDQPDCEEEPDHPSCGGETPDCELNPNDPACGGETPDCELNPNDPACQSEDPACQQPFPPPHCDDGLAENRIRPAYQQQAERESTRGQYAIREDYQRL